MNIFNKVLLTLVIVLTLALLSARTTEETTLAQNGEGAPVQTESSHVVQLWIGSADRAAPNGVLHHRYHILPARTDAAKGIPLSGPGELPSLATPESKSALTPSNRARLPKPGGFFPADLLYFGGAVVTSAAHDLVYFDRSDGTSWGDPFTFLADLGTSNFIHLTDQYVGSKANNRYKVGTQFTTNSGVCSSPLFCSANDILQMAHATALALGRNTGYGHIVHIFLPSGVDTCLDQGNTQCYSPDNPSSFVFCAYHASVVFNDVGKVLFTVQPFQQIAACATPDFLLNDSTNSTLSHEVFETITDPDGDAWFAANSLATLGFELADLCQSVFANDGIFVINKRTYQLQFEYSNKFHACAGAP
jgi:hypothetical protein